MTALGHCSHQAKGGRKLMGQLLVHSQRLGSLVLSPSLLFLVRNEQELFAHSPLPPAGVFCLGLLTWVGLRAYVVMGFHSSWTFISKYFWVFYKYLQWAFGQLVVMFETILL